MYRKFLLELKPEKVMAHKRLEKLYNKLILALKPTGLYKQVEVTKQSAFEFCTDVYM